jgi:transposase InsO family protein
VGEIQPKASNRHCYIIVAIDYFTKWVEAASYNTIIAAVTESFIRNHIITRYGVPHKLITNNGKNFIAKRVEDYLQQFKIQHHRSSPYHPQMNGAVESTNKNLIKILKKTVESGRDWHEKLVYALWAYRTSIRTSTGMTPYSLVYGIEAVLPMEVEIPSLRILKEAKLTEAEWVEDRIAQLNLIDEKRL